MSVSSRITELKNVLEDLDRTYDIAYPSRELIAPYEALLIQVESLYSSTANTDTGLANAAAGQSERLEIIELYVQNISQLACLYRQFYRPHNVVALAERSLTLTHSLLIDTSDKVNFLNHSSNQITLPDCFAHLYFTLLQCFSSVHELNSREFDLEPLCKKMLAISESGYQSQPRLWAEAYAWNLATLAMSITEQSRSNEQSHFYQKSFMVFNFYELRIPHFWQQEYANHSDTVFH
ncbi:hypothetical protein A9267_14160 [Shewanella sp. UCD-FRSSP16_17]|uniref:hypothetical protein n=1 Tax=unclassified Shewanella TaxID=196818 RepID=UPI0007EE9DD5|nr:MULTISPECIES: hypothetical protein [unclassified Shewanella]MBQ4890461.1 hypothetical protein [Shewanella sp. MMG014]OBT07014.1 hypothetical protein A9267_14160 [Shewanella sp. UCD-FRSSP16_17]